MQVPFRIDARGLRCPLPVLRCEKILDGLVEVDLEVLADDPVARIDIPLMAQQRGLACSVEKLADGFRFRMSRAPRRAAGEVDGVTPA